MIRPGGLKQRMPHRHEIWKPSRTTPGLEISNEGRARTRHGVLSTRVINSGYLYVRHQGKNLNLAREVLLAFVGPPPQWDCWAAHSRHKLDCRLENLFWATPDQARSRKRMKPSFRHGTDLALRGAEIAARAMALRGLSADECSYVVGLSNRTVTEAQTLAKKIPAAAPSKRLERKVSA